MGAGEGTLTQHTHDEPEFFYTERHDAECLLTLPQGIGELGPCCSNLWVVLAPGDHFDAESLLILPQGNGELGLLRINVASCCSNHWVVLAQGGHFEAECLLTPAGRR